MATARVRGEGRRWGGCRVERGRGCGCGCGLVGPLACAGARTDALRVRGGGLTPPGEPPCWGLATVLPDKVARAAIKLLRRRTDLARNVSAAGPELGSCARRIAKLAQLR